VLGEFSLLSQQRTPSQTIITWLDRRYRAESSGSRLPLAWPSSLASWASPGDLVLDPMCGSGTTLVEALHLGRPASSRQWQHDNATRLTAGHGSIIAEYFDTGYTRCVEITQSALRRAAGARAG
jgi:23S rRNA G2445 N2-methylase RlmL